ncbi:hypothetical protein ACFE04_025300 [Oxalis oulophora]
MATSLFFSVSGLLLLCLVIIAPNVFITQVEGRAFFVFGDSLVDNGNNNYLVTAARADAPPYGIDYPTHQPTGRFSNGFNIPDLISQEIGMQPTLPYLNQELTGKKLLIGANFASAGIGILNDTGIQFVNVIRMFRQLQYFKDYQSRLSVLIGSKEAEKLKLYDLGARRVLVTGTGPLGCVPAELAQRSRDGNCAPELQRAAELFNPQLTQMVQKLNEKIGSDIFIAANTADMHNDFIRNPTKFGN